MDGGYCTVPDVRRVLQEVSFDGALGEDDNRAVVDAITAQSKWIRSKTNCHFYVPDGLQGDDHDLVPSEPKSRETEGGDIPSTPHPQHSTLFQNRRDRYPHKTHGPFCRVSLDKNDATEVTGLKLMDVSGGFEDWTADGEKAEGEDWRLYVEPGGAPSPSYVDVRAASLPALTHYDGAIQVSYSYGHEGLPGTLRDAVAMRAAARLVIDDEAVVSIPDNGQLVNVQTKAQQWRESAEELLEVYT